MKITLSLIGEGYLLTCNKIAKSCSFKEMGSSMKINFFDFDMDQSIVAPVIYRNEKHKTTNKGIILPNYFTQEIRRFIASFNVSVGVEKPPYYRIDAYFNERSLSILEINAAFVDGWGTALNLARASNISVNAKSLIFPQRFASTSLDYLPELLLLIEELDVLGYKSHLLCDFDRSFNDSVYVYGRIELKGVQNVFPYDGHRLDNKLNLAMFSKVWDSDLVKIPKHYVSRFNFWEEVPKEVVLKFCDKGSVECEQARQSVMFNKPSGKAPFIKRCYKEELLIAQDIIQPTKQERYNCQLIIFVIGNEPVTGYVQYSDKEIINDNSIHGPLLIS